MPGSLCEKFSQFLMRHFMWDTKQITMLVNGIAAEILFVASTIQQARRYGVGAVPLAKRLQRKARLLEVLCTGFAFLKNIDVFA